MTVCYPHCCKCAFVTETETLIVKCDSHNSVQDIIDENKQMNIDFPDKAKLHAEFGRRQKISTLTFPEQTRLDKLKVYMDDPTTNKNNFTITDVDIKTPRGRI